MAEMPSAERVEGGAWSRDKAYSRRHLSLSLSLWGGAHPIKRTPVLAGCKPRHTPGHPGLVLAATVLHTVAVVHLTRQQQSAGNGVALPGFFVHRGWGAVDSTSAGG